MKDFLLTIFTPTYNRAHTISRTYESMRKQTCQDFVWLIVDDGSEDGTRSLVEQWISDNNDFKIKYIYKENGGMHTAHNVAYENIDTELNMCIDSDDCLAANAVEKIYAKWNEIKAGNYAGIIGLDADMEGNIIGTDFPENLQETTLMGYYAKGGKGDKKLVYRTAIIKKYPEYPVFEGEKYFGLNYKYRLIDQDYKMAVLNAVLCNVEYQQDGSSATMWKQYLRNPKGFATLRILYLKYTVSNKRAFIDAAHYVSSSLIAKDWKFLKKSPKKGITLCAIPVGVILTYVTRVKGK